MKILFYVFKARFIINMKIYLRYSINFFMSIFNPLISIAPIYFMGKSFSSGGRAGGFQQYTGSSDFLGFIIIGYMISRYVSTVAWTIGLSLRNEMEQGVLESNWCTPVNRIVLMISQCIFSFFTTTIEVALTGFVCYFVFGFKISSGLLRAAAYLIPGITGMLGVGMAIAALVLLAKNANPIIDMANTVLGFLSGRDYPLRVLPAGILGIALILPLTHMYDSSRAILIGQKSILSLNGEFITILISMFVFLILGNWIFKKVDRKCRQKGLLGSY